VFHVVTVHWLDDRWIEPQLRYLERNLDEFKVWTSLNGIAAKWNTRFHFAEDLEGSHHDKLNQLANIARESAHPDDMFLFVDGDAFPIAPVTPAILGDTKLAAVRRDENLGEAQPHPCFCVTPVGFWFDIEGDWGQGYTWTASNGEELTDSGGNLLGILTERGLPWRPLLRTNRWNMDPLLFGIYGDVCYHHGAGFRPPVTFRLGRPRAQAVRSARDAAIIPKSIPVLGKVERSIRYRIAQRREGRELSAEVDAGQQLSDEVFGWIEADENFYERFMQEGDRESA
jgi:hypothetical protein